MKLIASSSNLIDAVKAIAGGDCQYVAPDLLCVYDDSIGAHRDTFYDFDIPKALIFLSDCNAEDSAVPSHFFSRNYAGSFAVLSGSHFPGSRYSDLTAQLTDWPDASMSVRAEITPHFLRGDKKENGDIYYPFIDYDSRYQGYSFIPFKRGDVVIFSTRALHALLPTYSNHLSKLIGLVFLEGYSKYAGDPLGEDITSMDEKAISYLSAPYNLAMADRLTKGAEFGDVLASAEASLMGLVKQLSLADPLITEVFSPLTRIYRIAASSPGFLKTGACRSRESVMDLFHGNFLEQRQRLKGARAELPSFSNLLATEVNEKPHQVSEQINSFKDEILSKNYASNLFSSTPPAPAPAPAPTAEVRPKRLGRMGRLVRKLIAKD